MRAHFLFEWEFQDGVVNSYIEQALAVPLLHLLDKIVSSLLRSIIVLLCLVKHLFWYFF